MRAWLAGTMLVLASAAVNAADPLPEWQIADIIRTLAAEQIGVKTADIDTIRSLAAQGYREQDLHELVVAIEGEFSIVISDEVIRQAKWRDPMPPVSVRELAKLVVRQMRQDP